MKNEKAQKKSEKVSPKVLWTRIICLILAFLMVGSSLYVVIEFLLNH